MRKMLFYRPNSVTCVLFLFLFASCANNAGDVPFPSNSLDNKQPVARPLVFTAPKKLNWITTKTGGITPVTRPFNLDALPSHNYDSIDFRPFSKPPVETRVNFSALPSKSIDIDTIHDEPLNLRWRILRLPAPIRVGKLVNRAGIPLAIASFGPTQGLPGKIVTCLAKDRNGLLWIATDEGVYRYDGEYLQAYVTGLQGNLVYGMVEDNDGKIWGIQSIGIGVIDVKNNTGGFTGGIKSRQNDLSNIIKDDKGRLWVSNTLNGGVLVINPATRTFKHLTEKNGFGGGTAYDMVQDKNKNTWITTISKGIKIIDSSGHKITYLNRAAGFTNDTLTALALDSTGNIWASAFDSALKVGTTYVQVDVTHGIVKRYGAAQGFKNSYCFKIMADAQGRIWAVCPSPGTLQIIDPQKGLYRSIDGKAGFNPPNAISMLFDGDKAWVSSTTGLSLISTGADVVHPFDNASISTLGQDAAGNIWMGTSYQGIKIADPQKKTIRYLKQAGIANSVIQSFNEIDGKMWVTSNTGIDIIDEQNKITQHIGKAEGLTNDIVYSLLKDNTGNIWLTGPRQGIDLIDNQNKLIKHVDTEGGLNDGAIADVRQDKEGLIWLATINAGVDIINTTDGTVKYLNNAPGLQDVCNRILLPDATGRMWIGTDKGIYIADTKSNTLTNISTTEGLADNKVISLQARDGKIYAGTPNKVSIITPPAQGDTTNGWHIETMANSDILVKDVANTWSTNVVTKDGKYLWGDSGLTVINRVRGYESYNPVYVTALQVVNEDVHFLNTPQINQADTLFDTDTFYVKGQTPVNGSYYTHPIYKWDSVQGPYNLPVNLRMPYDKNYMQFQFVQAHTGTKDVTLYSYFLQGIDKQWSKPTANLFTENYLNLPSGAYVFKVAAKALDGKWGQPASFSFTILSPWWKTWWAYTLYILILIAAVAVFVMYRSKKLVSENMLLEEKVRQRTDALQRSIEELKTTQSQLVQSEKMASLGELTAGIAHEIQNPLNFVNNFSELNAELIDEMLGEIDKGRVAEAKALAVDIKQNEEKIRHHGKRADGIVKGMLQHSRKSSGQKEATDINALADEYLRLSYHGLRAKEKSFNATTRTNFDENAGKINIIQQDIGRIILNLLTNAFYAVNEKKQAMQEKGEKYEPTVTIGTQRLADKFIISVKDNGNGIPEKVLDKIFQPFFTTKPTGQGTGLGLSLSYDIIKAHGGEINVETKEGEGTGFIIQLPVT